VFVTECHYHPSLIFSDRVEAIPSQVQLGQAPSLSSQYYMRVEVTEYDKQYSSLFHSVNDEEKQKRSITSTS